MHFMKKLYFIFSIFILSQLIVKAQDPQLFFNLNNPESGNKHYVASQYINCLPEDGSNQGFRYTATTGEAFVAEIDPYMIILPEDDNNIGGPNDDNSYVGFVPGELDVKPNGSSNYTIPITIPKGINNFEPQLSLTYNSNGGNGIIANGWTISGIPEISRVPYSYYYNNKTEQVTIDNAAQLMFNGKMLIKNSDGNYQSEINDNLLVKPINGDINNGFEVLLPNGSVWYIGETIDERLTTTSSDIPIKWYITRKIDADNNYIEYKYLKETATSSIYPDMILYTGNYTQNTSPFYKVKFQYNDVTHLPKVYHYDNFERFSQITKQLIGITVRHIDSNTEIAHYDLEYSDIGDLGEQGLQKVYIGKDDQYLSPTLFEYYDNEYNYQRSEHSGYLSDQIDDNTSLFSMKISSQKYEDFVTVNLDGLISIYKNAGNGPSQNASAQFQIDDIDIEKFMVGDVSGDLEPEIILVYEYHNLKYARIINVNYINNSYSFTALSDIELGNIGSYYSLGDFNGDGIKDLFTYMYETGFGTVAMILSQQNSPFSTTVTGSPYLSISPSQILVGDYDGDYRDEIVMYDLSESAKLELVTGNQIVKCGSVGPLENVSSYTKAFSGDFNTDGKMDLIVTDLNDTKLYHSTGKEFTAPISINIDYLNQNSNFTRVFLTDINEDGRTDIRIIHKDISDNTLKMYDYLMKLNGEEFKAPDHIVEIHTGDENNQIDINDFLFVNGRFASIGNVNLLIFEQSPTWKKSEEGKEPGTWRLFYSNNSFACNNLKLVKDGLGYTQELFYYPHIYSSNYIENYESTYPVFNVKQSIQVVSKVLKSGNNTGIFYQYGNALYHAKGKGFLGFLNFNETNYLTGIKQKYNYSLDMNFFHVIMDNVNTYSINNGNLIRTIDYEYNLVDLQNKRFGVHLDLVKKQYYESNGDFISEEKEEFLYDQFNNITYYKKSNGLTAEQYSHVEIKEKYYNNIINDKYFIGLIDRVIHTKRSDNKPDIVATSKNHFTINGNLESTILYEGDNTHTTVYEHDVFGNITKLIERPSDDCERRSLLQYSPDGRFLIKTINGEDHIEEFDYNYTTGKMEKAYDINGLATTFYYDIFGRLYKTIQADGVQMLTQNLWAVDDPDIKTGAVYLKKNYSSTGNNKKVFFDLLGRPIREVLINLSNQKTYKDINYYNINGAYGLKQNETLPYFSTNNAESISYFYDDLGRIETINHPDGKITTYDYNKTEVTTSLFDGMETQIKKVKKNAVGEIIKSSDSKTNLDFTYYSDGKLASSMVASSESTKIEYFYNDKRELTEIHDPSFGIVSYEYDCFGNTEKVKWNNETTMYDYDKLGRVLNKENADIITSYVYDDPNKGMGLLSSISHTYINSLGETMSYSSDFSYDDLGRISQKDILIDDESFKYKYEYDSYSRVKSVIYPSDFKVKLKYDNNGHLSKVNDGLNREIYSLIEANELNQVTKNKLGPITFQRDFNQLSGNIENITGTISINGSGQPIQDNEYNWDKFGNLKVRENNLTSLYESFTYDNVNRLETVKLNNTEVLTMDYLPGGKINEKSDVGTYTYASNKPYQVYGIENIIPDVLAIERTAVYNNQQKLEILTQGDIELNIFYGPDGNRVKQVKKFEGEVTETKFYIDGIYEKMVLSDGTEKDVSYIGTHNGTDAVYTRNNIDSDGELYYLIKDHLGSIIKVVNSDLSIYNEFSYDAWGRLRNSSNGSYENVNTDLLFNRGYTFHEHLPEFNLINMNGRVYDPIIGQFLSPDPFITDPGNPQNYNRYNYVLNNPLRYTDPSGYHWLDVVENLVNLVTMPARVGAEIDQYVNDKINGFDNPNGYFNFDYIMTGSRPIPQDAVWDPNSPDGLTENIYRNGGSLDIEDSFEIKVIMSFAGHENYQVFKGFVYKRIEKPSLIKYDSPKGDLKKDYKKKDLSGYSKTSGMQLAEAINSIPPIVPSPIGIPLFNPLFGAGAVSIDRGGNFVGVEKDVGIILVLQGDDMGEFITYDEFATGGGTGASYGGEITRYDFTAGNENIKLNMLQGKRHKVYGGVNFYGVLGVGGAISRSEEIIDGYYIYGTTISLSAGISPFLIDCGYNVGNTDFYE